MQQVKLFKGVESDCAGLECEINAWLRESGARVLQVSGNIAPQTTGAEQRGSGARAFNSSDLFVVVLYDAGGRG